MTTAQAILYLVAVILLVGASFAPPSRVALVPLAGACALLAYSLPVLHSAFS